ncbi:MAG: hypothetical protein AAFN51_03390, partial [Pseudomonadota bacterium]
MFGSKSTIALVLVGALALAGCRAEPLQNLNNEPFGVTAASAPSPLTLQDYEKAIIRAGSRRNWIFERAEDGHLVGTNDVRGKHKAVVDV